VPRDARLINFFRQILFKIGSEEYSFQKKKKKKESHLFKWKVSIKQVFQIKYYPIGWRFYLKPEGLELVLL
jgi:hypothetical protein